MSHSRARTDLSVTTPLRLDARDVVVIERRDTLFSKNASAAANFTSRSANFCEQRRRVALVTRRREPLEVLERRVVEREAG